MKNVIIFGANRGIGLALTKKYLSNGCNVWAICRGESEALKKSEAHVFSGVDFGDLNQIEKLRDNLNETEFDILIHNAGIYDRENLFDCNEQCFKNMLRSFDINSLAPLRVVSTFKNNIKQEGKIGLMSSRMGSLDDNTSGGNYSYRMSKAALNIAGKSLSLDLPNIAIAILHPGYVKTDMTNKSGFIEPEESAEGLYEVMEKVNLANTGQFWHTNGEVLAW